MSEKKSWRRYALAFFGSAALVICGVAAVAAIGGVAPAHAQVSAEFQAALQPYGSWRRHARWGVVWVPARRPRGWQPYTHGYWVYTDEWGWYWISDRDEEDWGWVTYHYGRWVFDRAMGWIWVRGDEWAPAWVNWRRGGDVIGWAPLPPDALIADYEDEPALWIFVQPRYLIDPRVRTYILPPTRARTVLRNTVVVNRTLTVTNKRIAINAGVAPAVVGAAARTQIPAYRVAPRVVAGTQGVAGAVPVRPQDLSRRVPRGASRFGVTVQRTSTAIAPAASVPKPEPLGKDERGRIGTHPPRAAQSPPAAPTSAPPQKELPPPAARPAPRPDAKPAVTAPPRPAVSAPPVFVPPARRSDEPPQQAKPQRPIAPQTPPPSPPQAGTRSMPPAIARPAPPAQPSAAKPPPPRKPGEKDKKDDKN